MARDFKDERDCIMEEGAQAGDGRQRVWQRQEVQRWVEGGARAGMTLLCRDCFKDSDLAKKT